VAASLRRRRALVTGAGTRVGASIARTLGALGMRVAVHYHRSREGAEQTCAFIAAAGGEAAAFGADLSDRAQCRALVASAVEWLGGLDLLVPSAAGFERVPFDDIDDAAWDRMLRLNLDAPFVLAHAARTALRASRGSIVFVTCTSASTPYRHYLPYVVAKGGLQKLMRALALELAPEVRVNAVAPGTVLPPADMDEGTVARLGRRVPLARVGNPEDVAAAVVYLASATFVTGQEIAVDGGRTVAAVSGDGDEPL
jgi:pteridine reductase